ncbi:MAG: TIGR02206 family membrane protein [Chloroflexi bacterium]|jgi:hypothetical integral membrane protein (TIGR02206 family)|nr:TIGR02206 family membrane protein [Chloroflexota bacterium]
MSQYFAVDYVGAPFVLFGIAHLTALGAVAISIILLVCLSKQLNENQRQSVRYGLAIVLMFNEISYHIWNIVNDRWSLQWNLPLHLCSIFVWLSVYMLLTKNHAIFEFAYFLGISAAIQPLLTPDAGTYGFPHFYPVQLFISHGSIIAAAVFMAAVEGYRPRVASIWRIIIWGNIYLLVVTGINLLISSNYLYTLHKPHVPTLLDYLGPWPWYLLSAEGVALALCGLLYLPYLSGNRK